ncbi:MAG TPA: flagellar basal body-associated FliL family protein [Spirochaetota bacterium]|jgi:flagellar FliL protein|nr:flagellar basal body-associated FliL family protein [Spirochaetota bacterium]HOR43768.1 flagellar basal body-associated FliL family protein [Spirochaetota bacterium]HOU84212.1 flagellar basal body-associated FliL family protein [Spirochaetota bacterium]HPK57202.1 flagellar basal body-associated FliL family protein [Spirochaetota bacterium]HPM33892.1 flagellar basal body-associated FliL family protein [Spirochaetota bacterium]
MSEEDKIDDMEDEGGEGSSSGDKSSSGGLSKIIKILLYVVGGVLLIFLVIGISYLVSKHVQEKNYQREQDVVVAPPPPPLASYDLPAFSSTTNDPEPHFVKMTISLGYEFNADISSEITQRVPQMQHIINVILRGKSYEELDSVEDTLSLSEEIKGNLNSIFSSGKIKEIYFKEFIVN